MLVLGMSLADSDIDPHRALGAQSVIYSLPREQAPGADRLLAVAVTVAAHPATSPATVDAVAETLAASSSDDRRAPELDATMPSASPANGAPVGLGTAGADPAGTAQRERYSFVRTLGEGGMGRVDLFRDNDLMRDVAVKRLRKGVAAGPEQLHDFLREARVAASLSHPNLVPIHDVGVAPAGPFFVMTYVRGTPLSDIVARLARARAPTEAEPSSPAGEDDALAQFPLPRRLRIFMQACQGIAYAHKHGIVHRDLKPANIMIGDNGEVIVMDLGLARLMPGTDSELAGLFHDTSDEGSISGTPLYMSPEQARGEGRIDPRTDVYSMGAILFEFSCLEPSVAADSVTELIDKVARGQVRRIDDVAAGELPRQLRAIIDKAMRHDPDERYPTVAELEKDLERYLNGLTPRAERLTGVQRLARFYSSADPRLARLQIWEIESMFVGGCMLSAGLTLLLADGHLWLAVALLVLGAVSAVPFFVKWLTMSRAEP